jgi:hypothetical protein
MLDGIRSNPRRKSAARRDKRREGDVSKQKGTSVIRPRQVITRNFSVQVFLNICTRIRKFCIRTGRGNDEPSHVTRPVRTICTTKTKRCVLKFPLMTCRGSNGGLAVPAGRLFRSNRGEYFGKILSGISDPFFNETYYTSEPFSHVSNKT